jgi:hypothetical protein
LKPILTPEEYKYLYRLTEKATPLKSDCGKLCNSICCQQNETDSLGMYLFPGEEVMFTGKEDWLAWERHDPKEYDFPASWPFPVNFVKCSRACPRELRPLACRFYPLTPHIFKNGSWILIYDTLDLPYRCPLIEEQLTMEPNFIETVAKAWSILLKDHRINTLVREDSEERENASLRVPTVVWKSQKLR